MDLKQLQADLRAGKLTDVDKALSDAISALPPETPAAAPADSGESAPRPAQTIMVDLFEQIIALLGNHSVLTGLFDELKSVL